MVKKILQDENGTNIVLEYIFSLVIASILFTILLMSLQDLTNNTDRVVLKEEFDIISNDIANRITKFSNDVVNNKYDYASSSITSHEETFDLPELVRGKQYRVNVTYDDSKDLGTIKITYEANVNVYSIATFQSPVFVNTTSFYSSEKDCKISYDSVNKKINVEG
jgi:hypothetical protein